MKTKTRPRAGLIRRVPAVLYESASDTRAFLLALAQSTTDDALKKETGRFLDLSEKLARDVYRRHGIDPADRYRSDADRRAARLPPDLDRDTELAFARDILGRAGGLRFALEQNFKDSPGVWIAAACFALANAVAHLRIEFIHGWAYSGGAKCITAGKTAANDTKRKREPAITAKHEKWREIDAKLPSTDSASKRAEHIAGEVSGSPHAGSVRSIRKFLSEK